MAEITATLVKQLRDITYASMMECKKALVEAEGDLEVAQELLRKKGQLLANKKADRETAEGSINLYLNSENNLAGLVKIGCETDFVARNENFQKLAQNLAELIANQGENNFLQQTTPEGTVENTITKAITSLGENIIFMEGAQFKCNDHSIINAYIHPNNKIGVLLECSCEKIENKEQILALTKDICMHIAANNVQALTEQDINPDILEKERNFLIQQAQESGKPANIIEKMIQGRLSKFKKEICLLEQPFVKEPDLTIKELLLKFSKDLENQISITKFYKANFA